MNEQEGRGDGVPQRLLRCNIFASVFLALELIDGLYHNPKNIVIQNLAPTLAHPHIMTLYIREYRGIKGGGNN